MGLPDLCFGNPTSLYDRVKQEQAVDWVSGLDPRLSLPRSYRSDDLLAARDAVSPVFRDFGAAWHLDWNVAVTVEPSAPSTGRYVFRDAAGGRVTFGQTAGAEKPATTNAHTLRLTAVGSGFALRDGSGMVRTFGPAIAGVHPLASVAYPDGYVVTLGRAADGRLLSAQDNRGQRLDFAWRTGNDAVASVSASVGGTAIHTLTYAYESTGGLPSLDTVTISETATGQSRVLAGYDYATGPGEAPLLAASFDGRVDASGAPVAYGTFAYDAEGRVVSSTHDGGADRFDFATLSDGATGRVVTATNARGLTTTYTFAGAGSARRLASVVGEETPSCLGTAQSFTHNANGWRVSQVERNGALTEFGHDERGNVTSIIENSDGDAATLAADERVTTMEWHPTLRLPVLRETSHLREEMAYDENGLLLSVTATDVLAGSPSQGQARTTTFDYTTLASGLRVLTELDGPGLASDGIDDVTTWTHYADGTVETMTDPNGLVTTYEAYDAQGRPAQVTGPDGVTYAFTYDVEGRLTSSMRDPDGARVRRQYHYDEAGLLVRSSNSRGRKSYYEYDDARRLVAVVNPLGERMEMAYDALGNVTSTRLRDAGGVERFLETAEFDELGRVMRMLDFEDNAASVAYDVEDNPVRLTDELDNQTSNVFDPLNRLVATTDRRGYTVFQEHDRDDRLTRYTDPRLIETSFAYNGFGEVVSETSADRGTMLYAYDSRGLVTQVADARGIVSTYEYDDGGRLLAKRFPSEPAQDLVFTYDELRSGGANTYGIGRISQMFDGLGKLRFQYFDNGTLDIENRWIEGKHYKVRYRINSEGALLRVEYPSGRHVVFMIDDANQVTEVLTRATSSDPLTPIISNIAYEPFGPFSSLTWGDGTSQTNTYDLAYRLTGMHDAVGGTVLRDVALDYSERDDLTGVRDLLTPLENQTFKYGPDQRLTEATGPWGELTWTYDEVGNRLTQVATPPGGMLATDTYDHATDSNRLLTIDENGLFTRTRIHDAAGNVIQDVRDGVTYGYQYDAAGRLATLTVNGVVEAEYRYNALGQQTVRRLTAEQRTIHSVHDTFGNRIAEYEVDALAGTHELLREYVWMDGQVVAVIEGGVVYHVRTDHIGRPVFATDSSGLKVWEASYLPFGGVHVATSFPGTSTDPLELRFPGQWFQAESGLHQNWMRDYDPTTGRYIQADPLGLVDGASVYGYALQSPMRYVDPKGLCAGPLAIVCAGAVLGSSTTSTATVGAGAGTAIALALTVSPTAIGDGTLTLSQTYGQTCSIETRAQLIPSSSLPQISYAKGVPSPPFDYPSDWDGISPPAPGWTWQGAPGSRPGDRRGNWVSPDGGTSISPDFEHEEPIGPHIDITGKGKKPSRWFPNGTIEPKR